MVASLWACSGSGAPGTIYVIYATLPPGSAEASILEEHAPDRKGHCTPQPEAPAAEVTVLVATPYHPPTFAVAKPNLYFDHYTAPNVVCRTWTLPMVVGVRNSGPGHVGRHPVGRV